jgi:hypothetical protein
MMSSWNMMMAVIFGGHQYVYYDWITLYDMN